MFCFNEGHLEEDGASFAVVSNVDGLFDQLIERHINGLLYTRITKDKKHLLVTNPFRSFPIYSERFAERYTSETGTPEQGSLPPHIFEIAAQAISLPKATISIFGCTGSGKSYQFERCLWYYQSLQNSEEIKTLLASVATVLRPFLSVRCLQEGDGGNSFYSPWSSTRASVTLQLGFSASKQLKSLEIALGDFQVSSLTCRNEHVGNSPLHKSTNFEAFYELIDQATLTQLEKENLCDPEFLNKFLPEWDLEYGPPPAKKSKTDTQEIATTQEGAYATRVYATQR